MDATTVIPLLALALSVVGVYVRNQIAEAETRVRLTRLEKDHDGLEATVTSEIKQLSAEMRDTREEMQRLRYTLLNLQNDK
jgi:hypothetical protein